MEDHVLQETGQQDRKTAQIVDVSLAYHLLPYVHKVTSLLALEASCLIGRAVTLPDLNCKKQKQLFYIILGVSELERAACL